MIYLLGQSPFLKYYINQLGTIMDLMISGKICFVSLFIYLTFSSSSNITTTNRYKVQDCESSSPESNFALLVLAVNDPPLVQSYPIQTPKQTSIAIKLRGNDIETDSITFRISKLPSRGTLWQTDSNNGTTIVRLGCFYLGSFLITHL